MCGRTQGGCWSGGYLVTLSGGSAGLKPSPKGARRGGREGLASCSAAERWSVCHGLRTCSPVTEESDLLTIEPAHETLLTLFCPSMSASPRSPLPSATPHRPSSTHGPPRNKSSTTLSSHAPTRPKRNKSSSSLSSHHGHHGVQFAHHGKKPVHKRTGSTGRKAAIDFGFTSMAEPEEEERAGREERPTAGRRASSTGSVGTVRGKERGSRSRERGSRSRERRSKSRERGSRESAREEEVKISPMGSPVEEREDDEEPRGRGRNGLKPLDSNITIVGSVNSSNQTSGSDWESATDSPQLGDKALPKVGHQYNGEGLSGLAQVMGAGDRVEAIAAEDMKQESRPTTPTRTTGRAKFQLGSIGADYEDLSPRSEELHARPSPLAAQQTSAPPQQPRQERYPSLGLAQPSTSPTAPPTSGLPSNATPPRRTNGSQAPAGQSTVPFPTTSFPRASPVRPDAYRPRTHRQASNASFVSMASTRSFHGLMGASSPNFRRTASTAAPQIDRGTVALAELTKDGEGPARPTHKRKDSMGSIRSLRNVAESTTGRASTMGVSEARDLARRLRLSSGSASEGGAMGLLGNVAGSQRSSTGPAGTRPGAVKRSASGYFASLRGFATANLPGLTPPLSPSAAASSRYPIPGATFSSTSVSKGKSRASPTQFQPLISKFVEPSSYPDSPQLSASPAATRGPLFSRQHHSASTASLGAMSRTQQKAILARDAPYWDNGSGPSEVSAGMGSGFYSPASSQGNGKPIGSMQLWAAGLVREAERIDRQYRAVEKWRDPLGESLERVLPPRKVEMGVKKGRGRGEWARLGVCEGGC